MAIMELLDRITKVKPHGLKIGGKLIGLFLLLAVSVTATIGIVSYFSGSSAVSGEAVAKLSAVAELKTSSLETFLSNRYGEIHVMTGLELLRRTSDMLLEDIQRSNINPEISIIEKRQYLKNNSANYRLLFQYVDKYFKTLGAYAEIKIVAVHDIRNARGEIVFQEGDQVLSVNEFAANRKELPFYRGGYDLMVNKRQGVEAKRYDCTFLYSSSIERCGELNKSSIHMSHGIPRHGLGTEQLRQNTPVPARFSFMMIFDINTTAIDRICQDTTGMGASGESYLAEESGGKILMLTESRFEKGTALDRDLGGVKGILEHLKKAEFRRGAGICENPVYRSYHDTEVLAHNHMIKIGEHNVAMITEIDESEVFRPVSRLMRITVLLGIMVIVGASIAAVLFSRSISNPLGYGVDFASAIASGDLTGTIDTEYLGRTDEIGELSRALNRMVTDLRIIISNILSAAQNLSQAVQEIASGNENLSQRTAEQASAIEEIASTIEQATAAINQNAENSQEAARNSSETQRIAEDGGRVTGEAVSSIIEINQASKKIGEIITVINEIAFQTNLLALNAAVEAARAGEQGRGFAVVAGEVRNLAQRSAGAAKEIESLIRNSLEKVDRGTKLAGNAGDAIKEIVESATRVSRIVSEIRAASMEQKQGIDQINIAVSEMDTMTQQNASLVEETAAASEEMANQAQELLGLVQNFKIPENI
jgi:methyl-accepting chemotaxis protein